MSNTTIWIIIAALGIGTFAIRLSFIQLAGRFSLPPETGRALRFVPAAVLSALILPAVLRTADGLEASLDNPRLVAAILAALVAWWTKSVLATLAIGMAVLWSLQALL